MSIQLTPIGLNPFDDPLDRILAEIALSIQLPPSLHDKAKSRYEAVRRHLEMTTAFFVRIPAKPATYSNLKPATYSDTKAATIPISCRPPFRFEGGHPRRISRVMG